jgi:hypothetical protein
MENRLVQSGQAQAIPDRILLRAKLEATRTAFHHLLDTASGERWRQKSPNCAWSIGEVLLHLTWALEQLPQEVIMARQGKGMFNYPKWFAEPASFWIIRWQARENDPLSLRQRYDAAMDAVLVALEQVPESDWHLGAHFYGHGFHSVADLFETPADHLAEHTRD